MKVTKKLMKSNWDFVLYQAEEGYVINVTFCNSYVDITRSFLIAESDLDLVFEEVEELAKRIRSNYEFYKSLEIIPVVTL